MPKLTRPLLTAMEHAINTALAGTGFDGGDFDGENQDHYERALEWVREQKQKRAERALSGTR